VTNQVVFLNTILQNENISHLKELLQTNVPSKYRLYSCMVYNEQ